ncbi:metal-dependent hydrolase [Paracoccus sp. DMF-8]|uniref:metal-dependent hydrolase n=1 Tax=Paracoccus sp. DMF-8 TaxID=3019445 RepID=UPI0023E3BAA4|nr:metal-dependent hydrolase [Paracoccus sp. DMF-8]MDF3607497.1 metal-dependent hydrolase [Paracoccus sp. DMF-8]
MILAHLPSGYLSGRDRRRAAVMIGSVAPDRDMPWFWLVDQGQPHHHRFWPHIPAIWALIALAALPLTHWLAHSWLPAVAGFLAAILMHLVLDTWNGGIMWLLPWSNHLHELFTVPATRSHWVLSFMLHPSFLAEVAIIMAALWLIWRDLSGWKIPA